MKYKVIITITLFIFSILLIKSGVYFIQENDNLMIVLKEKQNIYNIEPINAIITEHILIPGINGKKINLKKSYNNMKRINDFKESLLVFDKIKPNKTIDNIYDKIIISGNPRLNQISILTSLDNKYCYVEDLNIKNECIKEKKHTILIHKITNNYLTNIKENLENGYIYFLPSIKKDELDIIIKYLKNNYFEIVELKKLINN